MMVKTFLLYLKFYFFKLFTSKYKVEGKCNSCGACCRNIVFMIGENYVNSSEQFEKLKEFDKKYYHFDISGQKPDGALLFKCKSLDKNNRCLAYLWRSVHCRAYPKLDKKIVLGAYETFETCGYNFDVNKKFKEYLE